MADSCLTKASRGLSRDQINRRRRVELVVKELKIPADELFSIGCLLFFRKSGKV